MLWLCGTLGRFGGIPVVGLIEVLLLSRSTLFHTEGGNSWTRVLQTKKKTHKNQNLRII